MQVETPEPWVKICYVKLCYGEHIVFLAPNQKRSCCLTSHKVDSMQWAEKPVMLIMMRMS